MAIKTIEIQDSKGEIYYPHTDASVVKYGDSDVATELNEKANPNLLINGDFRINQRDKSTYSASGQYSVDRWKLNTDGKAGCLIVHDGYIELKGSETGQLYLEYILEEKDTINCLGKKVTVSCMVKGINLKKGNFFIQYGDYNVSTIDKKIFQYTEINKSDYVKLQFTCDIPSNISKLIITIGSYDNYDGGLINIDGSICIKYVKLELGSKATPFTSRPYGEELALCKRYYFKNRWLSLRISNMGSNIITTTSFNYPVTMRITPTVRAIIEQPINQIRTFDFSTNILNPTTEQIKHRQSGIINEEMIDFQFDSNLEVKDYNLEIKDYAYEFDSEMY